MPSDELAATVAGLLAAVASGTIVDHADRSQVPYLQDALVALAFELADRPELLSVVAETQPLAVTALTRAYVGIRAGDPVDLHTTYIAARTLLDAVRRR